MSTSESRPPRVMGQPVRYTLFWPMLVFFFSFGAFTTFQIVNLETQFDSVTRAIDRMDVKVKKSQVSKERFYSLTRTLLSIAPHNALAEQIVEQYNLKKLVPDDASTLDNVLSPNSVVSPGPSAALPTPGATTNAAPVSPAPSTP